MNKFEDLIERFEGLLDRFEGAPGAMATGTTTASSASAPTTSEGTSAKKPTKRLHKVVKGFDEVMTEPLKKFIELSKKHENKKIHEASGYIKEMFETIRMIIVAITESKKESLQNMGALISPIVKDLDHKIGKCSKDAKIKNHVKSLIDSIQLVQLPIMDDPHDMGKEFLAQIDFFGNKVLTQRIELDVEWYLHILRYFTFSNC